MQTINASSVFINASFVFIIKGFIYKNGTCVYSLLLGKQNFRINPIEVCKGVRATFLLID
ncbi:hypothetical protein ADH74_06015 [Bacteroides caecimuris]|uniref:Uncharacterized protein n=1 Tax=Bacteroides caecimuris TaxID=1796613 RepID=A0A1V0QD37_9BACE|nr:hypothetical protein A4V03_20170 [Bacteroides caecimuris]OXE67068.1 hypothetical protein ADH74_06015 [Bacteroides caecimuris]